MKQGVVPVSDGHHVSPDGLLHGSLGSFSRFEDEYRAMVFENGQHCWSGPNRSIRVRRACCHQAHMPCSGNKVTLCHKTTTVLALASLRTRFRV